MLLVAFLAHSETRVVQPAREGKITSRLILPKRRKDVTDDPPSPYPLPHLLRPRLANKGAQCRPPSVEQGQSCRNQRHPRDQIRGLYDLPKPVGTLLNVLKTYRVLRTNAVLGVVLIIWSEMNVRE